MMRHLTLCLAVFASTSTLAATPAELLKAYEQQARSENPAFAGFSASRGKALYYSQSQASGKTMSCTTCHSADPKKAGKTPAFRTLAPLAPAAEPTRFTDAKKVEKWFRRNCDDVFKRACTTQEKGDFVSWIVSVR
ncbi:DUF1924 domain-containing protein [Crenobacter caeni]|nr:DUF1924 domain-containing protein [Crenobacter caeni]